MVGMAEGGSRVAGSDGGGPEEAVVAAGVRPRRMVALRPTSGPAPAAPAWAASRADRGASAVPGRASSVSGGSWGSSASGEDGVTGWRSAVDAPSASALAESVFPFGSELPFEPDPEAAAFLNAPRRPLDFYVAPFGTPPFGNPPTGDTRSVVRGPAERGASGARAERPEWGPAYPAGA